MPGELLQPAPTNPYYQNGAGSEDDRHEDSNSGSEGGSEIGSPESQDDLEIIEVPDEEFPLMFRQIDGRLYHASPTAPYALPVDAPEQQVSCGALS